MISKEQYRQFCRNRTDLPIFIKDWFLDAVCNDQWDVGLVERGGKIVACLPYFLKKKGKFRYVTMPPLTKFMGPFIIPEFQKPKHVYKIQRELINKLPKVDCFKQNFHYSSTNWLPFYWDGYKQTTLYSYRLENIRDLEQTFSYILPDYRNHKIKKAEEMVHLEHDRPFEEFFALCKKSYDRQELKFPIEKETAVKLDKALQQHQARKLLFAVDDQNRVHSALYLIWDDSSSYNLLAGDDPELRSSGAGIWLTWKAIEYTSRELGLNTFDFLGSMKESIERVRRNFGAQQTPYFFIEKYNSRLYWVVEKLLKVASAVGSK